MSTTLTNGLKLPDKGSVDWYANMQNNYNILDGAVGTIAEHTSQIAGKAGLTANNTFSGENTFSKTITVERSTDTGSFIVAKNTTAELGSLPSSDKSLTLAFKDKNNDDLCYARVYYETTGGNSFRIFVRNKYTSGAPSTSGSVDYAYFGLQLNADKSKEGILKASFRPYDNNTHDLGSNSYQWNNLYAKNYYYNGTAWGLDKANTWTGDNVYSVIYLKYNISGQHADLYWKDENDTTISAFRHNAQSITLGKRYTGKTAWYQGAQIAINQNGTIELKSYDGTDNHAIVLNSQSLYPVTTNDLDLGTSTNKWKSFNGINPGALSLPDTLGTSGTENVNYFNVIGYLNNTGTLATIPTTATYDGWLYINAKDGADSYIIVDDSPSSFGTSVFGNNGLGASSIGLLCLMCPIRKGHSYNVRIKSAGIVSARIYPAQGNV